MLINSHLYIFGKIFSFISLVTCVLFAAHAAVYLMDLIDDQVFLKVDINLHKDAMDFGVLIIAVFLFVISWLLFSYFYEKLLKWHAQTKRNRALKRKRILLRKVATKLVAVAVKAQEWKESQEGIGNN